MVINDYIESIYSTYATYVVDRADLRTIEWPLVDSPMHSLMIVGCYLYLSINAERLTASLPTFKLKVLLILYNIFMVALSSYMLFEFVVTAYTSNYNLACQPVDYSATTLPMRMAKVCWLYYFSKYIELLETALFALRKKYNQISFLHVYHHSSMILLWWLFVRYAAGGQLFIFGSINSFVHTIMYAYYGLSALGPRIQKYLWWKKYLTILQLGQFVGMLPYCLKNLWFECKFPKWVSGALVGYAISLLLLFSQFFVQAYLQKSKDKQQSSNSTVTLSSNGKSTLNNKSD